MARTKNRGQQLPLIFYNVCRRWRVGAYIRLSKEDLKKSRKSRMTATASKTSAAF